MIPKTIHYCWFGGGERSETMLRCLESWKRFAPDYELKEWNEENYDVRCCPYSAEAYEAGRYAFVSDVARFAILSREGGIYLDTDVELLQRLDAFLGDPAFLAYDRAGCINPGLIMGSESGSPLMRELRDSYEGRHFRLGKNRLDFTTVVTAVTERLKSMGFVMDGKEFSDGTVHLYPAEYFDPLSFETGELTVTDRTVSIHHYAASWKTDRDMKIYRAGRFLRKLVGRRAYAVLAKLKHRLLG